MKRLLSYLLLCLALAQTAGAQKQPHVMDWKTDATLNTWLLQRMHWQYAARQTNFRKALSSRADAFIYADLLKDRISSVFPPMPARTPLNPVITGRIDEDKYSIEKIAYESFPQHHVTANLYLPKGKGKFPAALLFCGHEDVSKATESYQKTALLFVKNGFAVLVIDPVSQSERYQLLDGNGKPLTRGGTTEHTLLNAADNLMGTSVPADELWDNIRGLDYLVTRPEVDTARIGCLGNSGGGMQTIYFAANEPRIKVMAPCSYLSSRERTMELGGPADGCAQMPGEGGAQLELDDYLIAAAPKPILILAGRYDFIDYTGVEQAYDELKRFYGLFGLSNRIKLFTYEDGHGISKPKREAAVQWFRRWLCHDDRPVHEDPLAVHTAAQLQVTATGQVGTAFPGERSLVQRNLDEFKALAGKRTDFHSASWSFIILTIRRLLGMNDTAKMVRIESTGMGRYNEFAYEGLILRRGEQPPLPAILVSPKVKAQKIVILLSGDNKFHALDNKPGIDSLLNTGAAVLLADLRGIGETEDRAEFNDPKYYNRDYRNVMLALHTGFPLVGQRVTDIQTILLHVQEQFSGVPVEIRATGTAAVPALHAAVILPYNFRWSIKTPIASYSEILERPWDKDLYNLVVPRALHYYDLPDLFQLIPTQSLQP